jgi:hypothetical protein
VKPVRSLHRDALDKSKRGCSKQEAKKISHTVKVNLKDNAANIVTPMPEGSAHRMPDITEMRLPSLEPATAVANDGMIKLLHGLGSYTGLRVPKRTQCGRASRRDELRFGMISGGVARDPTLEGMPPASEASLWLMRTARE